MGATEAPPADLARLIEAVDRAYHQFDDDRRMLERSLELSSQELLEANSQLRAVLDAFPDLFFRVDDDGTIREFRGGSMTLLPVPRAEVLGRRLQDLPLGDAGPRFAATLAQVREGGAILSVEYTLNPGEAERHYEARLIRFRESQIIVIVRDTTERKRGEEAMQQAKETAEAANRAKSALLANVSHELRTPLTYVQGYSELLLTRTNVPAERQRHWLRVMNEEAKRLSDLITELLDLSRIEQGRLDIEPQAIDLVDLVEERLALFRERSAAHRLRAEVAAALPEAWADPRLLVRILDNLLSNAIKYSPDGGEVVVRIDRDEKALAVSVRDEGVGISPEELDNVFERFHRVDAPETRGVSGFGLGLSIVKASVEQCGGAIRVASAPGRGSIFTFTVPSMRTGQI
jgi:signal transduction histidine kinase